MGNQQVKERRVHGRRPDWTNADCPSPPGKPYLVPEPGERLTDVITIRWSPPLTNGGLPITGYVVEHRRTGSPHWLRATPHLVPETVLPLTGLEPGWRYQFRVTAENDVGRSAPGELSEPLTVTPQKWAASAPFFNLELTDTWGLENEKVEFKVQVIGVPPPTISWYKDGFEVFSSRRTKIVTEEDRSTFIIHQAALEDEGEIKCTATNRVGHAVTKANLKLEAPPRIRLPRQYEDGLIFEKGEPIRLKVTVAGRPKPDVTWYHNGEIITKTDRIDVVDSKTGSMLKIAGACRTDRGEYAIGGVNKIGEDVTSFLVTVTDRPMPPGRIQVEKLGRKVNLTWSGPEDDGGCKIGSYIIEYFRVGWDMWLKARNSRQLRTSIENLIEGSEYKFRVRAENPYGISDPSEESELIFVPDPKRGVLEPPDRMDDAPAGYLRDGKRRPENGSDETRTDETRKRRLLEEKARKLLDTPLSELLPYETTAKRKPESSAESIPFSDGTENLPPTVPRRRNKGKKRLNLTSDVSDNDSRTLSPSPRNAGSDVESSVDEFTVDNVKMRQQRFSEPSENVGKPDRTADPDTYSAQSPLYPRETDDSIIHGSSELMLVIYPRDRSKSVELSARQRSEIELHLKEDGVAPPMSLSSPELSSTEPFELPPLREAVSSTELLYERTAARLYLDSIQDETQKQAKRPYSADLKSVERRSSFKGQVLRRERSFKEADDRTDGNGQRTPAGNNSKLTTKRERLSSVEKERIEFAAVRERLRQEQEQKRLKAQMPDRQRLSDTTTTTTSSSFDTDDVEEDIDVDEFLKNRQQRTHSTSSVSQAEDETYNPRNKTPAQVHSNLTSFQAPKTSNDAPNKVKTTSKLLKKFGLKKRKTTAEVTPVDPNAPPQPKPILKNKVPAKAKTSPMRRLNNLIPSRASEKSVSEEESESEHLGRKKKVRITEPKTEEDVATAEDKPVDANAVENQVLIYHYSDIVKEFGGHGRQPPRAYLNRGQTEVAAAKPPPPKRQEQQQQQQQQQQRNQNPEEKQVRPEVTSTADRKPEMRIYTSLEYATDVAMFLLACWLYFFKNELYAIPVLCIMAYRQLKDIAVENYQKLKTAKYDFVADKKTQNGGRQ